MEAKVADIAAKLELLPALLDKEKSFKKLGLEKELEQVKARESQRAYVTEVDETIEAFASIVAEFQAGIDDLELPELPADCPENALKGFSAAVTLAKDGATKSAAEALQAIEKARAAFAASKTGFDQSMGTG